jgi:hypothetical protein
MIDHTLQVSVYPNPASDQLHIAIKEDGFRNASALITDLMGRVILQKGMTEGNGVLQSTISLEGITSGLYMVVITSESGKVLDVEKVIVQ